MKLLTKRKSAHLKLTEEERASLVKPDQQNVSKENKLTNHSKRFLSDNDLLGHLIEVNLVR